MTTSAFKKLTEIGWERRANQPRPMPIPHTAYFSAVLVSSWIFLIHLFLFCPTKPIWHFELSCCLFTILRAHMQLYNQVLTHFPTTPCYNQLCPIYSLQKNQKKPQQIWFQLELSFGSIRVSSVLLNRSLHTQDLFI